jgi:isovaleryl-CoA dehydrogenase
MRGSPTEELVFDECEVPEENIMGPLHGGVGVLMSGLDYERAVLSGIQLGVMQACPDVMLPYVRERKQFGQPIGAFQLMQAKIADMYVALNSARAYVYAVAQACDWGQDHSLRRGGRDPAGERKCDEGIAGDGAGAGRRWLHQGLAGGALHARRQAARHRRWNQ